MKENKITLEKLAIMIKTGFDGTATKQEVTAGFEGVDKKFGELEYRLDRIENLIIRGQENRIEKLEDNMRLVKTKLDIR